MTYPYKYYYYAAAIDASHSVARAPPNEKTAVKCSSKIVLNTDISFRNVYGIII